MKVVSIGRNPDCDIVLNDNMISRNHALIKVFPFGKYEIVSVGSNGTKVNGNPIAPNQPYPLKRGDSVIFAQRVNLDWDRVPNPLRPFYIGGIVIGILLVLLILAWIIIPLCGRGKSTVEENSEGSSPLIENVEDTVQENTLETESKETETKGSFSFPAEKHKKQEKDPVKKNNDSDESKKDESHQKSKDKEPEEISVRIK